MFISIGSNAHSQNASDIFKEASKCTGLISDGKNFGSGFFINKNTFVTNYHVINHLKENNIEIRAQGSVFSIDKIIEINKTVDLALIRVSDSSENYFRIANPLEIKVGQTVYAIGNPTSFDEKVFKNTFTNGIINNILKDKLKGRDYMMDSKVILHSADLNPGNSGGPLLNEKGELVGINAYIRFNIEMMKFAIHADELISLLDKNGLSYLKGNISSNDKSDSLINKNTDQGLLKALDSLITGKGSLAKDSAAFLIKPLDSPDNTVFYILLLFGIGGLVFAIILYSGKKTK
ncbi:MAG: trypsin-like peptidase domain-containing protein [Ignavibacteria bacterium]|nr:trypsin-like peptidase domain-containing protein [Ignavibacteria bacterium]